MGGLEGSSRRPASRKSSNPHNHGDRCGCSRTDRHLCRWNGKPDAARCDVAMSDYPPRTLRRLVRIYIRICTASPHLERANRRGPDVLYRPTQHPGEIAESSHDCACHRSPSGERGREGNLVQQGTLYLSKYLLPGPVQDGQRTRLGREAGWLFWWRWDGTPIAAGVAQSKQWHPILIHPWWLVMVCAAGPARAARVRCESCSMQHQPRLAGTLDAAASCHPFCLFALGVTGCPYLPSPPSPRRTATHASPAPAPPLTTAAPGSSVLEHNKPDPCPALPGPALAGPPLEAVQSASR